VFKDNKIIKVQTNDSIKLLKSKASEIYIKLEKQYEDNDIKSNDLDNFRRLIVELEIEYCNVYNKYKNTTKDFEEKSEDYIEFERLTNSIKIINDSISKLKVAKSNTNKPFDIVIQGYMLLDKNEKEIYILKKVKYIVIKYEPIGCIKNPKGIFIKIIDPNGFIIPIEKKTQKEFYIDKLCKSKVMIPVSNLSKGTYTIIMGNRDSYAEYDIKEIGIP
jgi:hypothetical protein